MQLICRKTKNSVLFGPLGRQVEEASKLIAFRVTLLEAPRHTKSKTKIGTEPVVFFGKMPNNKGPLQPASFCTSHRNPNP